MLLHRRLRHRWEFYNGNFEALRKAAVDEEKYCLVNIQSRLEVFVDAEPRHVVR